MKGASLEAERGLLEAPVGELPRSAKNMHSETTQGKSPPDLPDCFAADFFTAGVPRIMSQATWGGLRVAEDVGSSGEARPNTQVHAAAVVAAAAAAAKVGAARKPPWLDQPLALRALHYTLLLMVLLYSVMLCPTLHTPAFRDLRSAGGGEEEPALPAGPSRSLEQAVQDASPPYALPGFLHLPVRLSRESSWPLKLSGAPDPAPLVVPAKPPGLQDIAAAGEEGMEAQGQPGGPLVSGEDEMSEDRGPPSRTSESPPPPPPSEEEARAPSPPPAEATAADTETTPEEGEAPQEPPRDTDVQSPMITKEPERVLVEPQEETDLHPSIVQPEIEGRAPSPPTAAAAADTETTPEGGEAPQEPPRDTDIQSSMPIEDLEKRLVEAKEETDVPPSTQPEAEGRAPSPPPAKTAETTPEEGEAPQEPPRDIDMQSPLLTEEPERDLVEPQEDTDVRLSEQTEAESRSPSPPPEAAAETTPAGGEAPQEPPRDADTQSPFLTDEPEIGLVEPQEETDVPRSIMQPEVEPSPPPEAAAETTPGEGEAPQEPPKETEVKFPKPTEDLERGLVEPQKETDVPPFTQAEAKGRSPSPPPEAAAAAHKETTPGGGEAPHEPPRDTDMQSPLLTEEPERGLAESQEETDVRPSEQTEAEGRSPSPPPEAAAETTPAGGEAPQEPPRDTEAQFPVLTEEPRSGTVESQEETDVPPSIMQPGVEPSPPPAAAAERTPEGGEVPQEPPRDTDVLFPNPTEDLERGLAEPQEEADVRPSVMQPEIEGKAPSPPPAAAKEAAHTERTPEDGEAPQEPPRDPDVHSPKPIEDSEKGFVELQGETGARYSTQRKVKRRAPLPPSPPATAHTETTPEGGEPPQEPSRDPDVQLPKPAEDLERGVFGSQEEVDVSSSTEDIRKHQHGPWLNAVIPGWLQKSKIGQKLPKFKRRPTSHPPAAAAAHTESTHKGDEAPFSPSRDTEMQFFEPTGEPKGGPVDAQGETDVSPSKKGASKQGKGPRFKVSISAIHGWLQMPNLRHKGSRGKRRAPPPPPSLAPAYMDSTLQTGEFPSEPSSDTDAQFPKHTGGLLEAKGETGVPPSTQARVKRTAPLPPSSAPAAHKGMTPQSPALPYPKLGDTDTFILQPLRETQTSPLEPLKQPKEAPRKPPRSKRVTFADLPGETETSSLTSPKDTDEPPIWTYERMEDRPPKPSRMADLRGTGPFEEAHGPPAKPPRVEPRILPPPPSPDKALPDISADTKARPTRPSRLKDRELFSKAFPFEKHAFPPSSAPPFSPEISFEAPASPSKPFEDTYVLAPPNVGVKRRARSAPFAEAPREEPTSAIEVRAFEPPTDSHEPPIKTSQGKKSPPPKPPRKAKTRPLQPPKEISEAISSVIEPGVPPPAAEEESAAPLPAAPPGFTEAALARPSGETASGEEAPQEKDEETQVGLRAVSTRPLSKGKFWGEVMFFFALNRSHGELEALGMADI
ncbi:hypothetical protein Emed_002506 [Eimeria media]